MSDIEHDERLDEARRLVRMIRDEPQWALSRVQRAAELEQEVERLTAAHQGAVKERDALRAAIFPFLRLDHDIGDEWHEDCERARAAYGGR